MQRERVSCQVVTSCPFCGWDIEKAHWVNTLNMTWLRVWTQSLGFGVSVALLLYFF